MAQTVFKVKARFEATDAASPQIQKVESRFKRLTNTIKGSSLAQIASIGGVIIAFRSLVRGIGAVIAAANKQEDAINALEGALAPLGKGVDKVSKSLQAQAAALQKVSKFGDETIIQAQALIAAFVKDEDQIKAATVATLDLAEAKGFDLVTAADLVSKTLGSTTNALTRYGIEVTGAVGSTERLSSLTDNVAKLFGGRAAKATETFSGKVTQLGNAVGDLSEILGDSITNNENFVRILDELVRVATEAGPAVRTLLGILDKVAGAAAFVASGFAKTNEQILLLKSAFGLLAVAGGEVLTQQEQLIEQAEREGISLDALNAKIAAQAETRKQQVAILSALVDKTRESTAANKVAAQANETLADATKRLKEEQTGFAESLQGAIDAAKSLGVVFEQDIQAQIDENISSFQLLRENADELGISFQQLESIESKFRLENDQLEESLLGVGKAAAEAVIDQAELGEAFVQGAAGSRLVTRALVEQIATTRRLATETQQLSAAQQLSNQVALASGSGRVQLPGGGSRLVNVQGGGRVQLPGGGSRLIRAGGGGGAFTSANQVEVFGNGVAGIS